MSCSPDIENCENNQVYGIKPREGDLEVRDDLNQARSHFEDDNDEDCADFNLGLTETSPDLNLLATFAESLSSATCTSYETLQDIPGAIYTSYLSQELMLTDDNSESKTSSSSGSTSSGSRANGNETDAMLTQLGEPHVQTCQSQITLPSSYETFYNLPAPIYTNASSSSNQLAMNTVKKDVRGENADYNASYANFNKSYTFHSYSASCAAPNLQPSNNKPTILQYQETPIKNQSSFREGLNSVQYEPSSAFNLRNDETYTGSSLPYGHQAFDDFLYNVPTTTSDTLSWGLFSNQSQNQTSSIPSFNKGPEYGTYSCSFDPTATHSSFSNDQNYYTYSLLSDSTYGNNNYAVSGGTGAVLPPTPVTLPHFLMPMPHNIDLQPVNTNDNSLQYNCPISRPMPSQRQVSSSMETPSSAYPQEISSDRVQPNNNQKPASFTSDVSHSFTFGEQQTSGAVRGHSSETIIPARYSAPVSGPVSNGFGENVIGAYVQRDSFCNSSDYPAKMSCPSPDVFCSICYPNKPDSSMRLSQLSQQRNSSTISVVKQQQNPNNDGTCVQQRRLVTVREMLLERARLRMEQVTSTVVHSEVRSNAESAVTGSGVGITAASSALREPSVGQGVQFLPLSCRKQRHPGVSMVRGTSPSLPSLLVKNPLDPVKQAQVPIRSAFSRSPENQDSSSGFSILRARLLASPLYPVLKKADVAIPLGGSASSVSKQQGTSVIITGVPDNSSIPGPNTKMSHMDSTSALKKASAQENKPPKHYDMDCLEIGTFKVTKPPPDSVIGKHVNRFKVFFIKRKFTYEFALSTVQIPGHEIRVSADMVMIEVPFSIVKAMRVFRQTVLIAVDESPKLYLGTRNDRHGTFNTIHFDRDRPTDITFGQLRTQQAHKIILRTRQIENLQSLLEDFDPRFKELLKSTFFGTISEVLPFMNNERLTSECPKLETKAQVEDEISARKRRCVIDNSIDSQFPTKKSSVEVLCHCQVSCRSNRCSCMKSKLRCGSGTSDCMCKLCDNPLNLLDDIGINLEEATADICLIQSIVSCKDDLRSVLEKRVRFPCCGKKEMVKKCIPGLTSCQNSGCKSHRTYKFSWCHLKLFDEETSPRNHCAACKSCKDPIDLHCQACRRCNPVEGNCTKCTVCGAFRDTSYTEQNDVKIVLKRYRQCKQRFEQCMPTFIDKIPSNMQNKGENLGAEGEVVRDGVSSSFLVKKKTMTADENFVESNLVIIEKQQLANRKYCSDEQPSSTTPHKDVPTFSRNKTQKD